VFKEILLAASIAIASFGAYGEEAEPAFEYKLISLEDVDGGDIKISAKDNKRIFVTAVGGWSTTYHKTANILKEKLKESGFDVVDKPEDAEIGVQIVGMTFDLEEVETGIDAGFNKANAAVFVAGVIATGGITLVSELARPSSTEQSPVKGRIAALFYANPTISSRGKMSGNDENLVVSELVFQASEEGAKRSSAAYLSFVDKLIANHFELLQDGNKVADTVKAGTSPETVTQ